MAEYSGWSCHWSVLLTKTATSLASASIFMRKALPSRQKQSDQQDAQQDPEKPDQHAAAYVSKGVPPAAVADELERLPLECGEGGVAAAKTGAEQQEPVLVIRRNALEDDDGNDGEDERTAGVDHQCAIREVLGPRLHTKPAAEPVA